MVNQKADIIRVYADRVPKLSGQAAYLKQRMRDKRIEHPQYIIERGEDTPEIRDWKWTA